jgi:hypothetical protein
MLTRERILSGDRGNSMDFPQDRRVSPPRQKKELRIPSITGIDSECMIGRTKNTAARFHDKLDRSIAEDARRVVFQKSIKAYAKQTLRHHDCCMIVSSRDDLIHSSNELEF